MYTKLCVLLLAIGLSQAQHRVLTPEIGLMKLMIASHAADQTNAARSIECLNTYMPLMTQLGDNFKKELQLCASDAESEREAVDEGTKDARTKVDGSAANACAAFTECSQYAGSVDFFDCYIKAGNDNTMVMYSIAADSSEVLSDVKNSMVQIDAMEYKCSNTSDRAYVEKQAALYTDFDRCTKGLEPLSTDKPTDKPTDAPTTPVPTTAAQTPEPTAEPTTAAQTPEPTIEPTTAAQTPEPTTEPTTAAPPTPEPTTEPTTAAPTPEPTTEPPTTAAPTPEPTPEPTTVAPTPGPTEAPGDKDLPEEDLSRLAQEESKIKHMVEDMKK